MRGLFPPIALASTSPRRQALLTQIGVEFRRLDIKVDERLRPAERPTSYVHRLALAKARAGWGQQPPRGRLPVLGADTAVVVENEILGKPVDRAQAGVMLARLSGRSHQVLTAVALTDGYKAQERLSVSTVTFKRLTKDEYEAYLASGEGLDKAGAYAIQGWAALFISRLEGSYSGVMGLPLYETGELLGNLQQRKNRP
ncbi:Maf family protein [Nitrosococcus watsonii]|uniref:dTTP/UTP pyrophosphatase n=1 Tax=Nitrosococcus watsoni (strain C-113) TaxID=105559 RepID=D8KAA8_NITWC|nr:Maf family protein [Nitrosococcus watsonii]ADJ27423.1 maf protein [Nitrosococcus watsonii C-113]